MKMLLRVLAALLAVSAVHVFAQTSILYQEDWGTTNGGSNASSLASVGWSQVLLPAGSSGVYEYGSPYDGSDNALLPTNILYFGGNTGMGIFFTTSGAGSGTYGDSAFTSIDPTLHTNLQFSIESQWSYEGNDLACWFAVQVGGTWYVSTNQPITTAQHSSGDQFFAATMTYNPAATNWNILTNTTVVGLGPQSTGNLSGPITGVGVAVSVATGGPYWDYNLFQIASVTNTSNTPLSLIAATTNQTTYVGGGVSFAVQVAGSQPYTNQWYLNDIPLTNGVGISGVTSNLLTIINASAKNAGTYSVIVSNSAGHLDTSVIAPATLTVNAVPPDYLYAETFPFVGPLNVSYSIGEVGWADAVVAGTDERLFSIGGGEAAFYAGESTATTDVFYTDTNLDTGVSGLPFPVINPASYPAVSFSVDVAPDFDPNVVTAYFAVQMNGSNWYANTTPIPVNTSSATATYATSQQQFQSVAAAWDTLTINANGATIGGQAPANLTGNITGAGVVVVDTGGGFWNVDNFLVTTDSSPAIAAAINQSYTSPYSQTVYPGAGVSFAVAATGTQPLSYFWQSNGVAIGNGGNISGANSNVLTILNVSAGDSGNAYSCTVSNSAGIDNSANYVNTVLTVNPVPSGLLYAELFPYIGPGTSPELLSAIGWAGAIPDSPDRMYQVVDGTGAAFSFEGGQDTTAIYTTTSQDTGASGLPFSAINLGVYSDLTFSVDIAPAFSASNVTAYFAVQMNGSQWYVSSTNLPVNNSADSAAFSTYTQNFGPSAANWDNLALTGTGATIGSTAAASLSGNITGTGLVFMQTGTGGTFDFDNFLVTGTATGVGGVTINSVTSTSMTLSWIGASNVSLQSTTNLSPPVVWTTLPATTGQSSATEPLSGSQKFFRLIQQ
ncbi:MAG TPA: immunoglobulin domain-containing protein [Candidatus Acidoferrum sp.]|jgi:hypothetical protein|nr:immunoglobulin domain-containing protein [Candidatus Acidoferrum sp.]